MKLPRISAASKGVLLAAQGRFTAGGWRGFAPYLGWALLIGFLPCLGFPDFKRDPRFLDVTYLALDMS